MPQITTTRKNTEDLLLKIALLLEKLESQSIQGGFFLPVQSTDADAPTGSIYYSTDQSKLVFKDYSDIIQDLY